MTKILQFFIIIPPPPQPSALAPSLGGKLFDWIINKGSYSECEAASIGGQIVNVVHVCHFMGVMHRDLKPRSFLMVSNDDHSPIKAADFGLSVFIEEG